MTGGPVDFAAGGPQDGQASNTYWRVFDNWALFQAEPEVQGAVGQFFGVVGNWLAFATDPAAEQQWVDAIAQPPARDAISLLSSRQAETIRQHFGSPVQFLTLLDAYERFGNDSLPDDPLRPQRPRHSMDGAQMWFNWSAFGDACLRLGFEPELWRAHLRAILLGLLNDGVWDSREPERLERFGKDDRGEWLGYQAWRPELDRILLDKSESHGAAVWQPCRARDPILEDGRLTTIETERGSVQARYFLDASGRSQCLSRKLGISSTQRSPRLCARFGYVACAEEPGPFDIPRIRRDADGWTWIARVRKDRCTWTRMRFDGIDPGPDWMPPELSGFHPAGSSSGADVTWRISDRPAGPGWFLLGDAAAVLDPASSHGVLRALMSGMQAASLIAACERAEIADSRAARLYTQWLGDWFDSDVSRLRKLYRSERTGLDLPIEQGPIGLPTPFDSRKNSTGETNHGAHQ